MGGMEVLVTDLPGVGLTIGLERQVYDLLTSENDLRLRLRDVLPSTPEGFAQMDTDVTWRRTVANKYQVDDALPGSRRSVSRQRWHLCRTEFEPVEPPLAADPTRDSLEMPQP